MKGLISIILLFALFLSACGSIGTETGNPELPPLDAPAMGSEQSDVYENYGIALTMPDSWVVREIFGTTGEAGNVYAVTFLDTIFDIGSSTIIVYIVELTETPSSLEEYLQTERPDVTFEVYENHYLSGFIYDDPAAGPNAGDLKEIYFLQNNTLLYIVAELFDGSGSTEAEIILSTIRFSE